MNLKLYQMFDTVAMTVFGPMIHNNRDEAVIRQFSEILGNPQTLPGQHPNDFILLHVREQNQDTGEIQPCDPRTIYTGRVWKRLQDTAAASEATPPSAGNTELTVNSATTDQLLDELATRGRNPWSA